MSGEFNVVAPAIFCTVQGGISRPDETFHILSELIRRHAEA